MSRRGLFWALGVAALLLAGVLSTFASQSPDGLERVAEDHGMSASQEAHAGADGPLAGYGIAAIDDPTLSGGLAGVTGVVVVLALATGLAYVVRRRGTSSRGR